jgi:hypothetical protein
MSWNPFTKKQQSLQNIVANAIQQGQVTTNNTTTTGTSIQIGGSPTFTTTSIPSFPSVQGIGAAGGGLTIGGAGAAGGLTIGTSGQSLTVGQNGNLFWGGGVNTLGGFTVGLTQDEQKEFESLKKDWEIEKKVARIAEFKKIASEMRQFVINALMWYEQVQTINDAQAPQSARLQELINKEAAGKMYTLNGGNIATWTNGPYQMLPLPEGLTVEDLKNAHIEQTLEEEMLNEEETHT